MSGSCQAQQDSDDKHWNAGNYNAALTFDDGRMYLNYTDGDSCHQGLYKRNTIIDFVCGDRVRPEYVHEDEECTYFLRFDTTLACENRVSSGVACTLSSTFH